MRRTISVLFFILMGVGAFLWLLHRPDITVPVS